jgi:hypothetical protein
MHGQLAAALTMFPHSPLKGFAGRAHRSDTVLLGVGDEG